MSRVIIPLGQHLQHLAKPAAHRLPGAALACGSSAVLDLEHEDQSWLLRLQCELRHAGVGARAVYIGTSSAADDAEYMIFARAMAKCGGIRKCMRVRLDLEIPAASLAFLEQSAVVWFGDTEWPDNVWRAVSKANGNLVERILWRHKHGALLVGVGGGAILLGAHGFAPTKPGHRPERKSWEGPAPVPTFAALSAFPGAAVGLATADSESPKDTDWELKALTAQLELESVCYALPREAGLLRRHDGSLEAVGREVATYESSQWHTQRECRNGPPVPIVEGLSFSRTGEYVATMGNDNNKSIAIYRWSSRGDKKLSDMRIGLDKGHNDAVYALAYNPVTDHVVAVGKKFIRFFGIKEGVEEARSDSRDAKLSEHESAIWAKKGVFGKAKVPSDIMCVAFANGGTDYDGTTFVGSAEGSILRFAEQATDYSVVAHPGGKVTALYFEPPRVNVHYGALISSGDDGLLQMWDPAQWRGNPANVRPLRTINMNDWVTEQLAGLPISLSDKEADKSHPKRGRPAAAHTLHGDGKGNILVGTVCNEIYEVNFGETSEAPFCYVQGHYEELWGYAPHPTKQEFCTGSEDETLRVWDIERRQMRDIAKMEGPVRCCCYSPDGKWIAVGMGSGGKAKKPVPPETEGKWVVLESEELELKFAPPQVRHERCSDMKFSPDGRFIAVGNADNFIDIYTCPFKYAPEQSEFRRIGSLKGHSSFVCKLDWSSDSHFLQSSCGAHELLYWKIWDPSPDSDRVSLRPRQEKTSSSMRDTHWATQSTIFGWALRGIWPEDADGTDVNAVSRSHAGNLVATADDFGKVKLFRFPCIVPRADHRPYGGHSSHVTNIGFTANDAWLVSTGGDDRAVFQWEVVRESQSVQLS